MVFGKMNKEELYEFIKEYKKEPFKTGEISRELKIEKKELDKIIKELKKDGKIISPKRCFYQIKT